MATVQPSTLPLRKRKTPDDAEAGAAAGTDIKTDGGKPKRPATLSKAREIRLEQNRKVGLAS